MRTWNRKKRDARDTLTERVDLRKTLLKEKVATTVVSVATWMTRPALEKSPRRDEKREGCTFSESWTDVSSTFWPGAKFARGTGGGDTHTHTHTRWIVANFLGKYTGLGTTPTVRVHRADKFACITRRVFCIGCEHAVADLQSAVDPATQLDCLLPRGG